MSNRKHPGIEETMKNWIEVDFNNQDEGGRVRLNLPCSLRDLKKLPEPKNGAAVWLTDYEGFVRATLCLEDELWLGKADWDTWEDVEFEDSAEGVRRRRRRLSD